MKQRITLSIDPKVSARAKQLAHSRKTSVSGLVEQFLRGTPLSKGGERESFVQRWAGNFSVAPTKTADKRMRALKKRFDLT
ncbi:MAG: DUF6364 family protein [bacterium]|nr:DUF6364 family protein [bacterium]